MIAREEVHSPSCDRECRGELGGAGEDLFFGVVLIEGDLVRRSAQEHCTPGAPVFYRAKKYQLLSALLAREDDLLLGITLHEYTSFAPLGDRLHDLGGPLGRIGGNFTHLRDAYKMN